MADAPPVKPWGKADKDQLQSLIDQGKVDIERSNTAYIDQVRHRYFRSRTEHNFRRNFRQYARSRELEDSVAGYRRREGKFVSSFTYFIDYYLTSAACRVDLTAGEETDTSEADNDDDDDDADDDDDDDDKNQPPSDMTKTSKAPSKKAAAPRRMAGAKSTGEEAICLDGSPPTKKSRGDAARVSTYFSTSTTKVFTVNPYSKGNKSLIDVVFHEGGYPAESAQPRITLLPGGKVLQVEWKSAEVLFSVAQASAQKIKRNSSRFAGYADTVDKMGAANEVAIDGYHKGKPQVIHLDQECTGLPKTIRWGMRSEQSVWDGQQWHTQYNSMYVTTLKVARERHTVASGIKLGGISSFGGNGGGGIIGGHGHTNRPPPPPVNNAPDHVEDNDDDEDDEDEDDMDNDE